MPKSFGGLIGFTITAVFTVVVGLWIVNRVGFLNKVVYGTAKAA